MRKGRHIIRDGLRPSLRAPFVFCLIIFSLVLRPFDVQSLPLRSNAQPGSATEQRLCSLEDAADVDSVQAAPMPAPGVCDGNYSERQIRLLFTNGGLPTQLYAGGIGSEFLWWSPPDAGSPLRASSRIIVQPYNFLRVGGGEWAPLCRAFSGKRLYLGAIRSSLYFRDNTKIIPLISA